MGLNKLLSRAHFSYPKDPFPKFWEKTRAGQVNTEGNVWKPTYNIGKDQLLWDLGVDWKQLENDTVVDHKVISSGSIKGEGYLSVSYFLALKIVCG